MRLLTFLNLQRIPRWCSVALGRRRSAGDKRRRYVKKKTALAQSLPATLCWVGVVGAAQEPSKPGDKKSDAQVESEAINPETARLELYIGPWTVSETHFDAKGSIVGKAKGTEEIIWILDRRAIRRTYTTGTQPFQYQAIGTTAWNNADQKYHGAWFDNASTTGPTIARGEWTDANRSFVYTLEGMNTGGTPRRFKVIEQFTDQEHRVATTYLLEGNEVIKQVEVSYERTTPCPAKMRIIFDGMEAPKAPKPLSKPDE